MNCNVSKKSTCLFRFETRTRQILISLLGTLEKAGALSTHKQRENKLGFNCRFLVQAQTPQNALHQSPCSVLRANFEQIGLEPHVFGLSIPSFVHLTPNVEPVAAHATFGSEPLFKRAWLCASSQSKTAHDVRRTTNWCVVLYIYGSIDLSWFVLYWFFQNGYLVIHLLIYLITHWLIIYILIDSFIHGFMHWFIDSLIHFISFHSFHSFIHSFIHSLIHSSICSSIHVFIRLLSVCLFVCSLVRLFMYVCMSVCMYACKYVCM